MALEHTTFRASLQTSMSNVGAEILDAFLQNLRSADFWSAESKKEGLAPTVFSARNKARFLCPRLCPKASPTTVFCAY